MGYQISRIRNTVILQCWQKNAQHIKLIFGPKKVFFTLFTFSVVWKWYFLSWCFWNYVICLGSLCSEIFLVKQGHYFLVNIFAVLFNLETNQKSSWLGKLSLNLNFNLMERWDSFIFNSFTPLNYPSTHPKIMMILNFFLNLQIHWIK